MATTSAATAKGFQNEAPSPVQAARPIVAPKNESLLTNAPLSSRRSLLSAASLTLALKIERSRLVVSHVTGLDVSALLALIKDEEVARNTDQRCFDLSFVLLIGD